MVLKTIKTGFCASLIVSCMLGLFICQNALCAEAVSVRDGLLSVNLKDNSLLEVARDIEKQSGVWFRGDETLFQEKISVTFTDLPLEEGLKRILTNLNYSLMFDAKNKVAGVMVMGEGKPAGAQPGRPGAQPPRVAMPPPSATRPAPTVRSRPSTSTPPAAVRRPPRTIPQPASGRSATRPGSVVSQSPNPDDSEIQENAPGSGGPAGPDSPLPPAFRVMENAPPPAAPVANKEPPAASKIIRNAQPPGGTTEAGGVSPVGSTPAKNASSSGEDSKSETTP
jgi:hypothetical protein